MQLAATNQDQAATIVAVLGAVATARGTEDASAADLAVIRAAARDLLGGIAVPEELAASIPGEVAEHLDTQDVRRLVLTVASILTLTDGTDADDAEQGFLDPVRTMIVDDLARYLRVSALEVVQLRRVSKQHRDRVVADRFRRFPVSTSGDAMTMVDSDLARSGARLHIDARRVHALWKRIESLPSGTVGAELIRYYDENGWTYPGTDHHEPLTNAVHDFHHVLGGYATTPSGEVQVGAFTAGAADRPLDGALDFLLWERLAVGSPNLPGMAGAFRPELFAAALERGARTTRELAGPEWDPWAIVERDLDEIRAEYEIGPGAQLSARDAYNRDPVTADY